MKSLVKYITESQIKIDKYMFHLSNPAFRNSISTKGLIPQKGPSTEMLWDGMNIDLPKCIFLFAGNDNPYDSTYDDDLWVVDTSNLDKSKFQKDPDEYMYKKYGSIIYTEIIPPECIILEYKGKNDKDTSRNFIKKWKEIIKKYK